MIHIGTVFVSSFIDLLFAGLNSRGVLYSRSNAGTSTCLPRNAFGHAQLWACVVCVLRVLKVLVSRRTAAEAANLVFVFGYIWNLNGQYRGWRIFNAAPIETFKN